MNNKYENIKRQLDHYSMVGLEIFMLAIVFTLALIAAPIIVPFYLLLLGIGWIADKCGYKG